MNGFPSQSIVPSVVIDYRSSRHYLADESASATIRPLPLSFTYIPKSKSLINAVKLTQRNASSRDVLTLYYPPHKIKFTNIDCQSNLHYKHEDMIFSYQPEHEARFHRTEYPTTQSDPVKGWHCHIQVDSEKVPEFIKKLFKRHQLDFDDSDTHERQFIASMHILRDEPGTKGLTFPDGSLTDNAECQDMTKSIAVDNTVFQAIH